MRDLHIFGKKKHGAFACALVMCLMPIVAVGESSLPGAIVNGKVAAVVMAPSGLPVRQHELVLEPLGAPSALAKTVRVRFVAEPLADRDAWGFERIEADFEALCHSVGLHNRQLSAPNAERVIISIASEPTNFGDSVPNVVQYFDSFLVQDNSCIWEGL